MTHSLVGDGIDHARNAFRGADDGFDCVVHKEFLVGFSARELMIKEDVGLVFSQWGDMPGDADSLSERQELGKGDGFFERRLADQGGSEVIDGVELIVMEETDFIEDVGFKQMSFVDDDDGLDLLLDKEFFDGGEYLVGDIGLSELWDDAEFCGDLGIECADVVKPAIEVDDPVRLGAERLQDGADGGRLAASDLSGEHADAAIDEEHAHAIEHLPELRVHVEIDGFDILGKRNVGDIESGS